MTDKDEELDVKHVLQGGEAELLKDRATTVADRRSRGERSSLAVSGAPCCHLLVTGKTHWKRTTTYPESSTCKTGSLTPG